ncbi:MAG: hypothetical protein ACP5NP_12620 [Acetobacteraceae bacterium]
MSLPPASAAARAFIALAGAGAWRSRIAALAAEATAGRRQGQALRQRHLAELTLARLARPGAVPLAWEARIAALAGRIAGLAPGLSAAGRARLDEAVAAALAGEATLIPLLHLAHTAHRHRARGFSVRFAGIADGAGFDLLAERDGAAVEIVCDVVSAEAGRLVPRADWLRLADGIDAELQTWLAAHPGRYLLKMTLPEAMAPAALHARIRAMLAGGPGVHQDAAVALRLDPLLLAGAQSDAAAALAALRQELGPEAHLATVAADGGMLVLAARAGREDQVAAAIRRRMTALAPARLSGTRPGILAMMIEDTDRTEWRALRERLELEGEARQFLTCPQARPVAAVSCISRLELLGLEPPDAAEGGELRFRNPAHPAARLAALAPVLASMA